MKETGGEVMEAVIVGTAEELMKTGMSTRIFQIGCIPFVMLCVVTKVHDCVFSAKAYTRSI